MSRTGIGARRQEGRAASRCVDAGRAEANAARRQVDRAELDRRAAASPRFTSSACFPCLASANEVAPKAQIRGRRPNGRVSVLVASGEAEIGLQQVSELMSNPDVEVIGLLPDKLQQITINCRRHHRRAKEPDAARALIKHLTTPEALAIYKAKGLGL